MKNLLFTFVLCLLTSYHCKWLSAFLEQYLIPIANKNGIIVYNTENNFINNLPGIVFHEDGLLLKDKIVVGAVHLQLITLNLRKLEIQ